MGWDRRGNAVKIHVLTAVSRPENLEEIATTAPFVADAQYFLVKNHINDTTFFEWDPDTYASYFEDVATAGAEAISGPGQPTLQVPELSGSGCQHGAFTASSTDWSSLALAASTGPMSPSLRTMPSKVVRNTSL